MCHYIVQRADEGEYLLGIVPLEWDYLWSVGWSNATVCRKCEDRDLSPPSKIWSAEPRKEARCNIEPTALGGEENCTGCYRTVAGISAWLRRSHAPG